MNGLYKGRYIIAVYDKEDNLLEVAGHPKELTIFKDNKNAYQYISRIFSGTQKSSKIHFIDVTQKHDDIFSYEDEQFLEFLKQNQKVSAKDEAKKLGISVRTYYRRLAKEKTKKRVVGGIYETKTK